MTRRARARPNVGQGHCAGEAATRKRGSTVISVILGNASDTRHRQRFWEQGMRALIVVLSMLGLLIGAGSAKADRRVALVAGNGAYNKMPPLANAAATDAIRFAPKT
jgi:hypothetical protein